MIHTLAAVLAPERHEMMRQRRAIDRGCAAPRAVLDHGATRTRIRREESHDAGCCHSSDRGGVEEARELSASARSRVLAKARRRLNLTDDVTRNKLGGVTLEEQLRQIM